MREKLEVRSSSPKWRALALLVAALPAMANITGTVHNRTIGKPEAGATVTLYRFGQGGMAPVTSVTADAQGSFAIAQEPSSQGPSMLRVEIDGVTYNHIMPPGSRAQGVQLDVYNASKEQGSAKVTKHMILFQPGNGQMTVNETFLVRNPGKTTWADSANGTLPFYLPAGAGQVEMNGNAPDGMPVPVPTDKTAKKDVYKAKFEIKPGETRFDLNYTVPYTEGAAYGGSIVSGDENTYLIAPAGVTLDGSNLQDLGQEPRTKARIFGLGATSYIVKLSGQASGAGASPGAAEDGAAGDGAPQIEEIMPRLYQKGKLIIGLALGILALGFAMLYRASAPGEANERGRG
ncbi:MAG TPA: hypothetical protein VKB88_46170 [Bryobacteraceae bacterium]|nr:hypothetical protein [Bryobacteraceae bacterium]